MILFLVSKKLSTPNFMGFNWIIIRDLGFESEFSIKSKREYRTCGYVGKTGYWGAGADALKRFNLVFTNYVLYHFFSKKYLYLRIYI